MLPSTAEFYCFVVLVFLAFWLLRRFRLACLLLICAANLFFYAKWGLIYLILIPAAATSPIARRLLLAISLAINIGLILSGRTGGLVLSLSVSFYAFQTLIYTIDIYRDDTKPEREHLPGLC
ncbi:MAG TPA: hypothetical protein VG297_02540 [Bryobacteraceae bacterium]|jgi:hypothetical protein|nr:hypothetical protein [Bryobacteraceae bacterium]